MKKVYQYLKEKGTPTDIVVEISLTPIVHYRINNLTAKQRIFHDQKPLIFQHFSIEYTQIPPFFMNQKVILSFI